MKYIKSLVWVVLAAVCSGLFFYSRSLPTAHLYLKEEIDPSLIRTFVSFPLLSGYLISATLILLFLWFVYSLIYAKFFRKNFKDILYFDAYTYLPLCLLGLAFIQYSSTCLSYFKELCFLVHGAGPLLGGIALLALIYLKIEVHHEVSHSIRTSALFSPSATPPTWRLKFALFLSAFMLYALIGNRLSTHLNLGGDEPHYLMITHSLLHDHDLAVGNNYYQKDYQAFFYGDLDSHVSIAKDTTRYSIHPIGMPILILPAYALYGHRGAVLFMNFLAALLALQLFLIAFAITQHTWLSLLLSGIVSCTSPLLLYSSQLYPEIPSALLLATAYYMISLKRCSTLPRTLFLGLILAGLPWLQQRMILPAILLASYHVLLMIVPWKQHRGNRHDLQFAIIPGLFLVLSGLAMAGYYYTLYGNPLPNAPYRSVGIKSVFSWNIFLHEGLLGLLFDQEGGLLIYSPYFLFLFAGVLLLFRQQFLQMTFLLLLISSIYIPCGGFTLQWRGAWSLAARYMVALIPFLFIPLCVSVKHTTQRLYRYIFVGLATISVYWSYRFLKTPFFLIMQGKRINNVLEDASRSLDLTRYFPSFPLASQDHALLTGLWLILTALLTVGIFSSACSSDHTKKSLENRYDEPSLEQPIRHSVRHVFAVYGGLLSVFLLFSFLAAHISDNTLISQQMKHRQLREVLSHFRNYASAGDFLERYQRSFGGTLRFEYLDREKRAEVNHQGLRFLVTGPQEFFPKGRYIAHFWLQVEQNASHDDVATLEIVASHGKRAFIRKTLKANQFLAAKQYQRIPLEFELRDDIDDLETRVISHNRVHLSVNKITIEPDLAEFYYDAGIAALDEYRYEEAKAMFLRTISLTNHLPALYQLGSLQQRSGEWEDSIRTFQQIIASHPEFFDAYYRQGVAFAKLGNLEKARQYFEQTTQQLPLHLDAWRALETLYREQHPEQPAQTVKQTIHTLYHPEYPYSVNFGNRVLFLGYSVQQPGPGTLRLEYYWQALTPMKRDYFIFVHFRDSKKRFDHDHAPEFSDPFSGRQEVYLTSQWQPGQLIREEFEISAPAGSYEMSLGVWEPRYSRQRLSIIAAPPELSYRNNAVILQDITIH